MLIKSKATPARFMSDIGRCPDISLLGWVRNLIGFYKARELVGFDIIGDRIADKSSQPDERTVRDWMGPEAFEHWAELRSGIEASYPGGFAPDWLYGGKKRGWLLRYKKTKAFCTLLPGPKRVTDVPRSTTRALRRTDVAVCLRAFVRRILCVP